MSKCKSSAVLVLRLLAACLVSGGACFAQPTEVLNIPERERVLTIADYHDIMIAFGERASPGAVIPKRHWEDAIAQDKPMHIKNICISVRNYSLDEMNIYKLALPKKKLKTNGCSAWGNLVIQSGNRLSLPLPYPEREGGRVFNFINPMFGSIGLNGSNPLASQIVYDDRVEKWGVRLYTLYQYPLSTGTSASFSLCEVDIDFRLRDKRLGGNADRIRMCLKLMER